MLFSPLSSLLPILFYAALRVNALHFALNGKPTTSHFHKRDHISGLDNAQNINYYTNITLGEQQFSVSIDTGSSDLWVEGNILDANDTGVSTGVQYAVGSVSGNVKTASLTFLNFSVPGQAFIQINSSTNPAGQGLIGLGPNVGSNVHNALKKQPQGDTVLDRIFRQDPTTPNILTVLLSRSDDPSEPYPGQITVSDILPGSMQNISEQPKLTVKTVPSSRSGDQHWQALLDPDGIIGPDGQPMVLSTKVSGTANASSLTTVFDTGFTLNQVPKNVSDAIYSRIPGAEFVNFTETGPVWTIPCNVEINITMLFGNMSFPIHPLDTSFSMNFSEGQACVGGFQPITTAVSADFDMILGMTFLRNVYLLINFGDFVDGTTTKAPPYVQLLSVTDSATAHQDFVQTRLGGVDTTGLQVLSDKPASSPNSVSTHHEDHRTKTIVISVVAGSLALASLAGAVYIISKRRRGRNFVTRPNVSAVDTGFSYDHTAYHPLQHAPPGEAHMVQGYHSEAGYASMYDPYAETARAQIAR